MRNPAHLSLVSVIPFVAVALVGCSGSSSSPGAPAGLTCSGAIDGGTTADSLTAALGSASSGSCVLLRTATYSGTFQVPAGVTLASGAGQQATLTGGSSTTPVVTIAGGAGSGLWNVDVTSAAGVGVAVRDGAASLSNVNVTGAGSAAFAALCQQGSSCLDDASAIQLDSVSLTTSSLGMWVSGALVKMNQGACTDESTTSLTGGMGVVVLAGGRVELVGVDIERNDGVGVLVDGAGGTTALIQDGTVSNNGDRGIWGQNLTGTMANPALSIQGATQIANNHVVGVGAVNSHGIIFVGGIVSGTQLAPVVTSLGTTDQIGDGVGFFKESGDVQLTNVSLHDNGRAAGVVDDNTGAIIFVGGDVKAGLMADLLVVVQDTQDTKDVQLPAGEMTIPKTPLSVSYPVIPSGSVL
jgi:hypothetical protein